MKITKRQLRRIIKETLLREGAKEDVVAWYGEIADMHSDSDAMDDLLGDLTDADLVAAGWEGGKKEVENYERDPMTVIDSLTPDVLARLAKNAAGQGGTEDEPVPEPKAGMPPTILQLVKTLKKNPAEAFRLLDAGGIRDQKIRDGVIPIDTIADLMNGMRGTYKKMIDLAIDVIDGKYTKEQIADREGGANRMYGGMADEGQQLRRDFFKFLNDLDGETEYRFKLEATQNPIRWTISALDKALNRVMYAIFYDEKVAPYVAELEKAIDEAHAVIGE